VIDHLKLPLAHFLPFTGQRLHEMPGYGGQLFGRPYIETFTETERVHSALCYDHTAASGRWQPSQLPPGQALGRPAPLFKKLDEDTAEAELARLQANE
jgi:methionyl-tRNA synthetase